jgi:hypothetical protein
MRTSLQRLRTGSIGFAIASIAGAWVVALASPVAAGASGASLVQSSCHLAAPYKHVIYIGNVNDLAAPGKDVYNYNSAACQFCANGTNTDYKGNVISSQVIGDSHGNSGFVSGFSPTPAQSFGYVASMQESGIPVSFAYIEDAHANWKFPFQALGPGDPTYVDQLKQQNQAYKAFFERLAADGIDQGNTLFVFTSDEGDHFAGTAPTAPCDGVTTPCSTPRMASVSRRRRSTTRWRRRRATRARSRSTSTTPRPSTSVVPPARPLLQVRSIPRSASSSRILAG